MPINFLYMTTTSVFKSLLIVTVFMVGSALLLPNVSRAGDEGVLGSGVANDGTGSGSVNDGTGAGAAPSVELKNVAKVDSIQDLLRAILRIVMILMVPIIVFFIILAGFKYATAGGNASQVEEASRALLYAIIGGVLILGAVAISEIIKNVVLQF